MTVDPYQQIGELLPMYHILYVDDEPDLLEIGKLFLEKGGQFSVDIQTSASAGLTLLSSANYDAIVSDYQMPEMDGIEFLKKVRTSGSTIPFILFTGRGREEVVIQALNEGADFYLQKGGQPLAQFTELEHHVRQAIQQRQAEVSIRDHEQREADIINFLPDATFAIDTNGVVIAWNRAMEKMTGVLGDQILGKGNYEYAIPFYHERSPILIDLVLSDNPAAEARYPRITRAGKKLFSEITIPHMNDGKGASIWFTASPLYDTRGVIVGAIESIRDITERKKAEEALRLSEENFRTLVENAPDAIYIQTNNRFVYLNTAAVRLFGASSSEELLGTNSFDRIHPSFHELINQRVRSLTIELKPVELIDEIYVKMDGTSFDVEVAAVPFRYGGENGALIFFRDITKRKQAESELRAAYEQITATEGELRRQYRELTENEQKLRQSEARYRNVVEVQTELISRFRPDGTHVFVNEAYCRYFGKSREEIIGHTFIPHIPVEDRASVKLHFASLTPSHPVDSVEHRIIMPGGEIRWQRWNDRAIFDEKGNVTEFQSVGRDITDRRQAEEALRESEEKYHSILDQIQDVFYRTDMQGILTMMSPAGARILGYDSPDEVRGLDIARDLYADPEKRKEFLSVLAENGTVDNYPITIKLRDGSHRYATASSHFYYRADGTFQGIEGIIHDITDIRRAEDALRQANRQLNLMTNITRHDILNKVTIILGYLALAKKKVAAPVMDQFIDNLELETKAIRSQIEFTRVYQELGIHEPQWQELDTVISRLHIPADIALAADVQGVVVFADPMLEKVFSNLLDNSVRHGQRVTEIRVSSHQSGEDLVVVWEDNGIGIAADEKERIFERGFGKNTGLGMFLVREILFLTGITIKETGVPGKGARFEITVPKGAYRILAGRR